MVGSRAPPSWYSRARVAALRRQCVTGPRQRARLIRVFWAFASGCRLYDIAHVDYGGDVPRLRQIDSEARCGCSRRLRAFRGGCPLLPASRCAAPAGPGALRPPSVPGAATCAPGKATIDSERGGHRSTGSRARHGADSLYFELLLRCQFADGGDAINQSSR